MENFLSESRSTFIAQEPKLTPLPTFLSWRPPSANVAGDAHLLAPPASRERSTRTPPEHLLQREARGIPLAQAIWSVSRHSQATSVSCFVSFLISLCLLQALGRAPPHLIVLVTPGRMVLSARCDGCPQCKSVTPAAPPEY